VGLVLFWGVPIIASFVISFFDWKLLSPGEFAGVENYTKLGTDRRFKAALWQTIYYTLGSVPLNVLVALAAAILVNQKVRGVTLFRTLFYLPSVTAGVAISILWYWMFNPDFGLFNWFLGLIGVPGIGWIWDRNWAMPSIILMSAWSIGANMVIFLAGLQGIPEHLYDAVDVDGATRYQRFRHVTLPMLSPVIFFVSVITVVQSFQIFTNIYVMTRGERGTMVLALYLFFKGFEDLKMGYASAIAVILFVITGVIALLQFRLSGAWVYYEEEGGQ
jgi:multiple sugar transport system permease protein